MKYTDGQEKLKSAIGQFNDAMDAAWSSVVGAVSKYVEAMERGEANYDACFPPELERAFDHAAFYTAWIYSRLESMPKDKRDTANKIKKAMGYNVR
ncbi:MAG: hypothetical protein ACW99G_11605 [Candidatus Thorarchaeota archaeon]